MSEQQPRTAAARARRKTPWRDNIEALIVAVVMAVFLKYFIVEAYKIPTGSMQPTLMGQAFGDDGGIFDRILVDKFSFHYRDPQRFEVVVFKYPLDRAKNFVKRLVGMPGEDLRIANGDLLTRADASAPFKPLRRPRAVQQETWKWLDDALAAGRPQWRVEEGAWEARKDGVTGSTAGRAIFVGHGGGPIVDRYLDGYPAALAARISPRGESGVNEVGDLRVEGRVRAGPETRLVAVDLTEGDRRYRLELPGPAAPADARPRVAVVSSAGGPTDTPREAFGAAYRLPAGRWVDFGAQNLDDLLELDIDDDVVAALEIAPAPDSASSVRVVAEGGGVELRKLRVARDIYYTPGRQGADQWTIPPGHYFMLGDNTQDSSDSREWTFWNMSWDGPDAPAGMVRGNWRPFVRGSNPLEANPIREPSLEGRLTWFRDEWGERHVFASDLERPRNPEDSMSPAPFVPRELITGRALLVFWPISPSLKLWRLRWVH